MEMGRKDFLKSIIGCGCGIALLSASRAAVGEDSSCSSTSPDPRFNTCQKRMDQGQIVIKRIISKLDEQLDQPTRERIMEACGRICHDNATPNQKRVPTAAEARGFLDHMRSHYQAEVAGDETIVYFEYRNNPQGLNTADGYCLCPIFEIPPKDVSSTYCNCSRGYVAAIFEQGLGKPAKVELVESVLRGGKRCRFKVQFKTA
jgi:hypothetical protein